MRKIGDDSCNSIPYDNSSSVQGSNACCNILIIELSTGEISGWVHPVIDISVDFKDGLQDRIVDLDYIDLVCIRGVEISNDTGGCPG